MPFWSKRQERDLVCGMMVDPKKAAATHQHQGKTYYFCSAGCKVLFVKEPSRYLKQA
jgi:Cu+-exporting ATPase